MGNELDKIIKKHFGISRQELQSLIEDGKKYRKEKNELDLKYAETERLEKELNFKEDEIRKLKEPLAYKEDELLRREEDMLYREKKLAAEKKKIEKSRDFLAPEDIDTYNIKQRLEELKEEVAKKEEEARVKEIYVKAKMEELRLREQGLIEEETLYDERRRKIHVPETKEFYVLKKVEKSTTWAFLEAESSEPEPFDTIDDVLNKIDEIKETDPVGTEYFIVNILKSYSVEAETKRKLVEDKCGGCRI